MTRPKGSWAFQVVLWLATAALANVAVANGILVPTDRSIPCLGITHQRINVSIRDQAAVTRVEQEFYNPTSQALEATYIFPLPPGAGVKDFKLYIDGKPVSAEIVESDKARGIYEDIVRRMKDPGLLESMDNNLWKVRVYPVPARGTQKIEISYSQIARFDAGIAEYVYPLKAGNQATRTRDDFTIRFELQSTPRLLNVYSPSHDVSVKRDNDHHAIVGFEASQYALDRDFQLFWTVNDQDVGLSMLTHRESPGEPGYFLMLLSPRVEMSTEQRIPRDVVFAFDASGSMQGEKIAQARNALEFCLKALDPADRFGVIRFSTTAEAYAPELKSASAEEVAGAVAWVKKIEASGGTAIQDALDAAFSMRRGDDRPLTIVFLTDGLPTIGVTDPAEILKNAKSKNLAAARVFAFGVGDDVNAHLLDQLADATRGASVYVRPKEDLEVKVSSFFQKIQRPVLTDLRLAMGPGSARLTEMYPAKLPDLFHGGQLVVVGRYEGEGAVAITLEGKVAGASKSFVYESVFPSQKTDGDFIPGLWARRKIGYLLDQIRLGGKSKELVDEVVALSKRFGIPTPYTSYLAVPDVAQRPMPMDGRLPGLAPGGPLREDRAAAAPAAAESKDAVEKSLSLRLDAGKGKRMQDNENRAVQEFLQKESGAAAVDVAQALGALKNAKRENQAASRVVDGRTFVNVAGAWIDDRVAGDEPLVRVKYLSKAYFRILELAPAAKRVFALGDRVVWKTPAGKTLAIDATGADEMSDDAIRALFGK